MNTEAALAKLLDDTLSYDERRDLFFGLLDSDSAEIDKPLLVSAIIKSGTRDLFRSTVIVHSPSIPSPETVSLLQSIVEDPNRPSESWISLIALTKIQQVDAVPMLKAILASSDDEYLRNTAIVSLQHLPPDVGNMMLAEIVNDSSFSLKNQLSAAFALSKRGLDAGRQLFWSILEEEETNRNETVISYCGLAFLKDREGILQFIEWLGYFTEGSSDLEDEMDKKYRVSMLKLLCGFEHEDEFMDCTAKAIEHLERLVSE